MNRDRRTVADSQPGSTVDGPSPVFICGRQHSGNSLMATILARLPGCFSLTNEGTFFEHRPMVDQMEIARRPAWMASNLKIPDASLTAEVESWLTRWIDQHPDADALALYREAMRFVTEATGNRFWAQKATSYVFFGHEILRDMPDARFIYMFRNPYDVAASKKRRDPAREYLVGWTLSWNRGVRLANDFVRHHPGRVHVVRFEQMVRDPEPTLKAVCQFLGVSFHADVLEVAHINPAEDRYRVIEGRKGFDKARVYYYPDRLDRTEIAAIDALVDRRLLEKSYGDLPHRPGTMPLGTRARCLWRIGSGGVRYLFDRVQWARRQKLSPVAYILRRLRPGN